MNTPASLLELALAEQESRHGAALAAIRARTDDIHELQRLNEALVARGFAARPLVDVHPVGALAVCCLIVWVSCSRADLSRLQDWLAGADITLVRSPYLDVGDLRVYHLKLRGQEIRMNVALTDRSVRRFTRAPRTPEAA